MDCSPEYVEDVESKQKPIACVGEDQLMKRKNRRSRHMTMKYDNMSKMISDLDAAKQLNEGESMQKLPAHEKEPMKQGTKKGGHIEDTNPVLEDGQREQLGDKVKSSLEKGQTQEVQLTENVDGCVGKNKVKRRELTKRMLGFYKLRKKVITIKKEKARLVKSMENLVQKQQNTKLKLVEEKESAEIKAAALKSLNLVLIEREVELKEKEEEMKCIKVNVADMKATVSKSMHKSVSTLNTVEDTIKADIVKIERKLAQRWRIVGKKKLLVEKQKLAAMLDTICTTSQTLQEDAVLLDTFQF